MAMTYLEAVNAGLDWKAQLHYDVLLLAVDLAAHGVEELLAHCLEDGGYGCDEVMRLPDDIYVVGPFYIDARPAKDLVRIILARQHAEAAAVAILSTPD